jgi:hypothetical protein
MWKLILTNLASFTGGIYIYLIVAATSGAVVGYGAYSWTSSYYIAKIERANELALKEKDDIEQKGDKLVVQYIEQIDKLATHNANLQKQITLAVGPDRCTISNGFVRLYNASTSGEATAPSGLDGTPSAIDTATLLSVAIENNEKYRKLADQLTQLQAFESQ